MNSTAGYTCSYFICVWLKTSVFQLVLSLIYESGNFYHKILSVYVTPLCHKFFTSFIFIFFTIIIIIKILFFFGFIFFIVSHSLYFVYCILFLTTRYYHGLVKNINLSLSLSSFVVIFLVFQEILSADTCHYDDDPTKRTQHINDHLRNPEIFPENFMIVDIIIIELMVQANNKPDDPRSMRVSCVFLRERIRVCKRRQ